MATRGTKWLYDRSTDLVPYLISMAAAERWYQLRGIARRIDQRLTAEVAQAVAALSAVPDPTDTLLEYPSVHPAGH